MVDAPPAADPAGQGLIEPGFAVGEVFIKVQQRVHRLVWSEADAKPAADRRRALPPGEHQLLGFRVPRTAKDGANWILSTCSSGFRKVTVQAGKTAKLGLTDQLALRFNYNSRGKVPRLGMMFQLPTRTGITIYRNGKRIPMGFRLLDGAGKTVGEGTMRYG